MVDSNISYETLKQVAATEIVSPITLNELKSIFNAEIASPRRRECIRNIAELIVILERRDVISEYNTEALHEIAMHCGLLRLREALSKYYAPKYLVRESNEYREQRLADNLRENVRISTAPTHGSTQNSAASCVLPAATSSSLYPSSLTEHKRSAIHKLLAKEMGKYWRRFGRELDISEGQMDNIESEFYRDLSTSVYKLLRLFEENECNDPKKYVLNICRALDRCQRKDLRRKVEDIMSH